MSTVGSTSAPSYDTMYYDALLTTTLAAYRPKMFDNIFKSSAFLAAMKKYDGIEYVNGGERIKRMLMYEENTTFGSLKGYDVVDTTPQDGMTAAFYEWTEIAGTISISRRELRQNSGEAAILDLLKQKTMQAEMSLKSKVNQQLIQGTVSSATFVPGNSAKDLLPLGYFLPLDCTADPVAGGNVGNISRGTYSWWRPQCASFGGAAGTGQVYGITASTWKTLKVGLNHVRNLCSKGADGSSPNLIVTDQYGYENYENGLDQGKQYTMDDDIASLGFQTVRVGNSNIIWDEYMPDLYSGTTTLTYSSYAFLNTQYYKLVIDKDTDFVNTPFLETQTQLAKSAKLLFMGQATVSNIRKLGVACMGTLAMTS